MKNYNLLYTESSKSLSFDPEYKEDIAYIKKKVKKAYEEGKDQPYPSQVERLIKRHGEDAVYKTGFIDDRFDKPIIIKMYSFDCFGDKYITPMISWADGKYNYRGFTEESLWEYVRGHSFLDIALAAAGCVLISCYEMGMEEIAKKLETGEGRFELRAVPSRKEPIKSEPKTRKDKKAKE